MRPWSCGAERSADVLVAHAARAGDAARVTDVPRQTLMTLDTPRMADLANPIKDLASVQDISLASTKSLKSPHVGDAVGNDDDDRVHLHALNIAEFQRAAKEIQILQFIPRGRREPRSTVDSWSKERKFARAKVSPKINRLFLWKEDEQRNKKTLGRGTYSEVKKIRVSSQKLPGEKFSLGAIFAFY